MSDSTKIRRTAWFASGLLAFTLLVGLIIVWLRKQFLSRPTPRSAPVDIGGHPSGIEGLSEAEAAARQPTFDLEAEIEAGERQFRRQAIRQSLFTTFNVDLFGIALVLLLLGSPDGAFGTTLIILLNLIINVFQQMYTKRKLDRILKDLRPQASVIRGGQLQSIDPAFIVQGDHIVVGAGDQILVDGELVYSDEIIVEEINIEGTPSLESNGQYVKQLGDPLKGGSHCIQGRSVYKATEDGITRYQAPGRDVQLLMGERTPLQSFMELVFRALFVLVLVFGLLLVGDALIKNAELVSREYRDAFSIVFGIAPTSLFFILIMTYVVGTLRISEHGALVYESRSIEEIASITTLAVSKDSVVSELKVTLDPIEPPAGYKGLSENLVQRILGAILHSVPLSSHMGQMLADALPGESRQLQEIAPFLFVHGWYGATFDEPDLRGTYILGLPEVLEDHLVKESAETLAEVQRGIGNWLRRIMPKRENPDQNDVEPAAEESAETPAVIQDEKKVEKQESTWRSRFINGLDRLLSPMEDVDLVDAQPEETSEDIHLLFAYLPETKKLYDQYGRPSLPKGLIQLTRMHIKEALRPEVGYTVQSLVENGIKVKLLSQDAPERAATTVQQLGLAGDQLPMIDSSRLEEMEGQAYAENISKNVIFGNLSPAGKAGIVQSLRESGERVLMVGSQIGDVPAMRQADIRVALKSSAQAALQLTDVVLLEDSLEALPYAVTTGQRLVNGVLATFKLYLSHVISQLLLIIAMVLFSFNHFPYHPTQAGVISAFTIAIPNALLSVWAAAGRVTGTVIRRQLARFIIPASIATAILAGGVYKLFISRTGEPEYAEMAVTTALLMAGWLRVLFVQPPTSFWAVAVPLRGDRRVINLVIGSVLIFAVILAVPLFRDLLRINFLDSVVDYGLVMIAVAIWMVLLRAIWRSKILEPLIDRIAPEGDD